MINKSVLLVIARLIYDSTWYIKLRETLVEFGHVLNGDIVHFKDRFALVYADMIKLKLSCADYGDLRIVSMQSNSVYVQFVISLAHSLQ